MEQTLTGVKNIHVSALEENGNIIFLHKIKEGSVDKSYGIHVAKLANMPDALIKRANEILEVYENKEFKRDIKIQEALPLDALMNQEPSKHEQKIEELNPLEMTPMDALNTLFELKEIIKENK